MQRHNFCQYQYFTMADNNNPIVPDNVQHVDRTIITCTLRRCSACGSVGHNKRRCPTIVQHGSNTSKKRNTKKKPPPGDFNTVAVQEIIDQSETQNVEQILTTTTTTTDMFVTPPTRQPVSKFDINECIYIVFDLETTGRSSERHYITEIACELVDCSGSIISDTKFSSLVRPPYPIPQHITALTGISNDMVKDKPLFDIVGKDFLKFIVQKVNDYKNENDRMVLHYIFVAHNGRAFDLPFLFINIEQYAVTIPLDMSGSIFLLDTYELAKSAVKE